MAGKTSRYLFNDGQRVERFKKRVLIAFSYMVEEGKDVSEAAKLAGCAPITVTNALKRQLGKEIFQDLLTGGEALQVARARGLRNKLMESDNERVALDAIKDTLDRGEGKAKQRIEQTVDVRSSISINITAPAQPQALAADDRGRIGARRGAPALIDATAEHSENTDRLLTGSPQKPSENND